MTKQEAEEYLSRDKGYREFGSFKMAIHGPGDVLKALRKREAFQDAKLMDDDVLFLDPIMNNGDVMHYAGEILDWYDFAAEFPELEIAVTGAAIACNSGGAGTYSMYSPPGSSEFFGIGEPAVYRIEEDIDIIELYNGTFALSFLDIFQGSTIIVVYRKGYEYSAYHLLDRELLEEYSQHKSAEPVPPRVAATADIVSRLYELKKNSPENEQEIKQVIQELWKTLYPNEEIRFGLEDGKYICHDSHGGDYFLLEEGSDSAFFYDYYSTYEYESWWDYGGLRGGWLPHEMFEFEELHGSEEEDEDGSDW